MGMVHFCSCGFGGDRRSQPGLIHASVIPIRMAPVNGVGGGDRLLSSEMLAGLTLISETPFSSGDISPTGLLLHGDSLGSFTWYLGSLRE